MRSLVVALALISAASPAAAEESPWSAPAWYVGATRTVRTGPRDRARSDTGYGGLALAKVRARRFFSLLCPGSTSPLTDANRREARQAP
jgi:hypothetical protein